MVSDAAAFLDEYPDGVAETAKALRAAILAALPKADETVDRTGRVVGYSFGPGYAGLICTIIPSKTGVKLGIVNSATLPDPAGLLEGAGKKHKHVLVKDAKSAKDPALKALLKSTHAAWNRKP